VLYHNERFLIDAKNPVWQHYQPFKWWLLPHAVFGAIVLLFAPLQFSDRLRQRFTKTHRVMGRLYVLGAFILAPLGAYIQYYQERLGAPRSFAILAIVDAVMLVGANRARFSVRNQAKNRAASPMGNSKLRDRSGVHWRPLCFGSHWLGSSGSRNCAGNHLVLPGSVSGVGRYFHPLERNPCCFVGTCQGTRVEETDCARWRRSSNLIVRNSSLVTARRWSTRFLFKYGEDAQPAVERLDSIHA
jgi:hypothetical protein